MNIIAVWEQNLNLCLLISSHYSPAQNKMPSFSWCCPLADLTVHQLPYPPQWAWAFQALCKFQQLRKHLSLSTCFPIPEYSSASMHGLLPNFIQISVQMWCPLRGLRTLPDQSFSAPYPSASLPALFFLPAGIPLSHQGDGLVPGRPQ